MTSSYEPLAERVRPKSLDDIVGQEAVCGPQGALRRRLDCGKPFSFLLWGPPGTGKTTIARLVAASWDLAWHPVSAISASTAELKKQFEEIRRQRSVKPPVFFVDEIHHFNRSQQDIFLPYVETGDITLIGATTENPSFELNPAFLSRLQVFTLAPLEEGHLRQLMGRVESVLGHDLPLVPEAKDQVCQWAMGDGRYLLNLLEAILHETTLLSVEEMADRVSKRLASYDKSGDQHYNSISVLHKAIRGSDVDGALYWLGRMLVAGEDPKYILRRLIRCASEDIGLADPQALLQAMAAFQAYEILGSPEGELMVSQAVAYLATAPKSNAVYVAHKAAQKLAASTAQAAPPLHGLNAPTKLMKQMGYAQGYQYDHDAPEGFSGQNYFPPTVPRVELYGPVERGFEREIAKRLAWWGHRRKI